MQLQIKQVILWPKNKNLARREVDFELGMVNVITGASQTGKSAIV
jgi:excinuclease UvrABC ATPase subunit